MSLSAEMKEAEMKKNEWELAITIYHRLGRRDSLVVKSTGCLFRDPNSIPRTHVAAHKL